jgi:hypothetical protein
LRLLEVDGGRKRTFHLLKTNDRASSSVLPQRDQRKVKGQI